MEIYLILFLIGNLIAYDTDPYDLKNYRDFNSLINDIKELETFGTYFKIDDVFDKYEKIERKDCEIDFTGKCRSYLIEIA